MAAEYMFADRAWVRGARVASWLLPLAIFLASFGVYSLTAARTSVTNDAYSTSVGAWRIAMTGKPWLDGVNLDQFPGSVARVAWIGKAPNGHIVTNRMVGPIIIGVPFYWLLDRQPAPAQFSIAAGGIAAAWMSALAVMLFFLAIRRRLPEVVAATAALAFAFTTPTWSVSANGLWTHTLTQFGIAGAAWALSRQGWWYAGAFLGVGMFGRPHVAVIAAVVGLGCGWSRRSWGPVLGLAVPTLGALGLLELWNRYSFGMWSIGGAYGDGRIGQAAEGYGGWASLEQLQNYAGFLFSADRGLVVWSPVLLLLLPAVVRSWRQLPDWARWLILGGLLYTFFQLRLNYFAGGDGFFGYRHGLELLTCLAPAFALSLPRIGKFARALTPPVLAAQFAAFALGATVDGYFVPIAHVWTDNNFWLALRYNPAVLGAWTALCLLAGAGISIWLWKRWKESMLRSVDNNRGDPTPAGVSTAK